MLQLLLALAAAIDLVELHGPQGQRLLLNPVQITAIREPHDRDLKQHFTTGTHCVIVMTSGKFVSSNESCQEVLTILTRGDKGP